MLFDKNKQLISCPSINAKPATITELAAGAAVGDEIIKVKDASTWVRQNALMVAFNVDDSLDDLPNFNLSPYIKKVSCGNGFWEIELSSGLKKGFPDGTKVRQHADGPYMFCGFANQKLSASWQEFSGVISGSSKFGGTRTKFWKGTQYVKVLVMKRGASPIFMDNIVFEKITDDMKLADNSSGVKIAETVIDAEILKQHFYPLAFSRRTDDHVSVGVNTTGWGGGFACDNLQWQAAAIKQIEASVATQEEGGYVMLEFVGRDGAVPVASSINVSIPPDGQFHKIIFPVMDNPQWRGTINTLRIRWCCRRPAQFRLASISGKAESNVLPDAEQLKRGVDIPLYNVRPRGKYVLSWKNGECPGISLRLLDDQQREINVVNLTRGKNETRFNMPELAVKAILNINTGTGGFPQLQLEQISDPIWPAVAWRGNWIWSQREPGPEYTNIWFKKNFSVPGDVSEATLSIAADDLFDVFINGHYAGHGNFWPKPERIDLKKYLKEGINQLIIKVRNITLNGGMICDFYAIAGDNEITFCSDETWNHKVGGDVIPPSPEIEKPVIVIGNAASEPWKGKLGHSYCGSKGSVEIQTHNKNTFTVKTIKPTVCDVSRIKLKVVAKSGETRRYSVPIAPSTGNWRVGDVTTVTYDAQLQSPDLEDASIYIDDPFVRELHNHPVGVASKQAGKERALQQATISGTGTRPELLFGGRKYVPTMWVLDSYVSNPDDNIVTAGFAKTCGIDLLGVYCRFIDFWKSPNSFDFSDIDKKIETALVVNPNAIFMLQIYCYMPDWWLKNNPDETCKYYSNRPINPGMDKQSLASKKWLADSRIGLKALVEHIKKASYADKIFAASFSESINSEWFWNQSDKNNQLANSGHSKAAYDTFRMYLREKYVKNEALAIAWNKPGLTFETFTMPTPEEQIRGRFGVLLDPTQDQELMDWFEFRNRALGEAIIALCKIVKEETDGKWLTGAYYGYFVEFCSSTYRNVHDVGHNHFLEVAKSPYVDFVRAPSRYYQRMTGMADGIMQVESTFSNRGKLIYVEQDFRSFTGIDNQAVYGRHNTPYESIGALNRAFGMMLAQGVSHYWLDFGRWLEEKCLLKVIANQNRIYNELPPVSGVTPKEVCIIHDHQSVYYTKIRELNGNGSLFLGAVGGLMRNFNEIAVPYNHATLSDLLEEGIISPHKLYIITTAIVLNQKQRQLLIDRFEREKAAVLWIYAPGLFYPGQSFDVKNVGDFLQLKVTMEREKHRASMNLAPGWGSLSCENWNEISPYFYPENGFDEIIGSNRDGRPMLVSFRRNGTIHYFSTLTNLPNPVLRKIALNAGVHVYNIQSADPMWIGNDVIFMHAKSSGVKSVIPPKGTQMKAIVGPINGVFMQGDTFVAEAGQTYGFLVKKMPVGK